MSVEFLYDSGRISQAFSGTIPDFTAGLTVPTGENRVAILVVTSASTSGNAGIPTVSVNGTDVPLNLVGIDISLNTGIGAIALGPETGLALAITTGATLTGTVRYRVVIFSGARFDSADTAVGGGLTSAGGTQSVTLGALDAGEIFFTLSDYSGASYAAVSFPTGTGDPANWTALTGATLAGGGTGQVGAYSTSDSAATSVTYSVAGIGGGLTITGMKLAPALVSFNCDCDDENDNETLGALRTRLLKRLGFAAQAASPPPGMATLLDDFLISAQTQIYRKYPALRTERMFTWTMDSTNAIRFYDLAANEEVCTKRLDALRLSWVGISDDDGVDQTWTPLYQGIPPEYYTGVTRQGRPYLYEIRQCIEVFPAPDRDYQLRIKGHFKPEAFSADGDQSTVDSELVFLHALWCAKAHYGQPDAALYQSAYDARLKDLNAGAHGTACYVPGTAPAPIYTRPRLVDDL